MTSRRHLPLLKTCSFQAACSQHLSTACRFLLLSGIFGISLYSARALLAAFFPGRHNPGVSVAAPGKVSILVFIPCCLTSLKLADPFNYQLLEQMPVSFVGYETPGLDGRRRSPFGRDVVSATPYQSVSTSTSPLFWACKGSPTLLKEIMKTTTPLVPSHPT